MRFNFWVTFMACEHVYRMFLILKIVWRTKTSPCASLIIRKHLTT